MNVRKANENDIMRILELLNQVLEVHVTIRPDLFTKGKTKYNKDELLSIINDDKKPVYVAEEDGEVLGYCFCIIKDVNLDKNVDNCKTLYIDDLCVDEKYKNRHIGKALLEYVKDVAKSIDVKYITLNVWEGNDIAKIFYEKNGFGIRKTEMEYKIWLNGTFQIKRTFRTQALL